LTCAASHTSVKTSPPLPCHLSGPPMCAPLRYPSRAPGAKVPSCHPPPPPPAAPADSGDNPVRRVSMLPRCSGAVNTKEIYLSTPPVCRDPGHYRSTARNTLAQLHRSRVAGLDLAVFEPPHAVAPLHGRISRKGLEPRRDGARRGGLPSSGRGGWKAKAESEMKAISPTLQTHD
jgi:hypothetical protein